MKNVFALSRFAALLLMLSAFSVNSHAIEAIIDTDEVRTTPVQHRYIHGVILDDAKFQILLPVLWNGKVVIHSRGFSGTEFSTGAFLPAALAKGYAFAASDEGWNRVTIKDEPEDYLLRIAAASHGAHPVHGGEGEGALWGGILRTLIMGGSNGGHHTKWMLEDFPDLYDGGIAGYGFNSQVANGAASPR